MKKIILFLISLSICVCSCGDWKTSCSLQAVAGGSEMCEELNGE